MIIGFLGKGGSGKSTLSTRFATYLQSKGNTVLAVDADHNMDFSYNLGMQDSQPFIGGAMAHILAYIGATSAKDIAKETDATAFSLSPVDSFTEQFTTVLPNGIRLMAGGPQTEDVLYNLQCSHALTTPLKLYLPLLKLADSEYVVVDEKAGADGVSTGIVTGFDMAVIVTEPTVHGLKTASQIADLLDFFETPYIFALNKSEDTESDEELFVKHISNFPDVTFSFDRSFSKLTDDITQDDAQKFEIIIEKAKRVAGNKLERTKKRIQKAEEYKASKYSA